MNKKIFTIIMIAFIGNAMPLFALTRLDIVNTARQFADFEWTVNRTNILNNIEPWDEDDRRTVDRLVKYPDSPALWWPFEVNKSYRGIAYCYGWKDDRDSFFIALSEGKVAGLGDSNGYTNQVSSTGFAGIDCSGLVSYAYGKPGGTWGTEGLLDRFVFIEDPRKIGIGDVLNKAGVTSPLFLTSSLKMYPVENGDLKVVI